MNDEIKNKVYVYRLENPIATQKEIADEMNLSESMVSRAIKSTMGSTDYNLGLLTAGKFLEEFQMASDYWKMQLTRYEKLKEKDEKGIPTVEFEKELELMKEQSKLWEKIIFLARQGEAIEVMRLMRNGTVKLPIIG